jgi:hypothetical protein
MTTSHIGTTPPHVDEIVDQMQRRLGELIMLRASPDMYGSELLDGQVTELELWLQRFGRLE